MKNKKLKKIFIDILVILFGNACIALAVAFFVIPNKLLVGGTAGIAVALHAFWGIPEQIVINILVFSLFIVGAVILGKGFFFKTITSTIAYPILLALATELHDCIPANYITMDTLTSIVCSGVLVGVGIGVVYKRNASTGGMDTIGLVIHKYCKALTVGAYLILLDGLVMLIQLPTSGLEKFIFGIVLALIYSFVIDKVVMFGKNKVELLIISNKQEEVKHMIIHEYDRTVTLLHSRTGYLNHEIDTIMTIIDVRELNKVKERIYALDPGAFIVINKVTAVAGRGFTTSKKYKSES